MVTVTHIGTISKWPGVPFYTPSIVWFSSGPFIFVSIGVALITGKRVIARERTDYPAGIQVAEVNPRPFWGVEIYYVQVANSFDPLEM